MGCRVTCCTSKRLWRRFFYPWVRMPAGCERVPGQGGQVSQRGILLPSTRESSVLFPDARGDSCGYLEPSGNAASAGCRPPRIFPRETPARQREAARQYAMMQARRWRPCTFLAGYYIIPKAWPKYTEVPCPRQRDYCSQMPLLGTLLTIF